MPDTAPVADCFSFIRMWQTWMCLERTTFLKKYYDDETLAKLKLAKLAFDNCHNTGSDEFQIKRQQYVDLRRKCRWVDATYPPETVAKRRRLRKRIAQRLEANRTNFQKCLTHSENYRSLEKKFSSKSMVLLYRKNQEFEKCINLNKRATIILQMVICRVTIIKKNLDNPTLLYALPASDLKTAATPMISSTTRTLAKKLSENLKQEIPGTLPFFFDRVLTNIIDQEKVSPSLPTEKVNLTNTRIRRILIREACLAANSYIRPRNSKTGRFSPEALLDLLQIIDPDIDIDLRSIQSIQSDYDAKTVHEYFEADTSSSTRLNYAPFSYELSKKYFQEHNFKQPYEICELEQNKEI